MILRLVNEYGAFEIGGANHPSARLQEISGLGLVSKDITTITYSGADGRVITGERVNNRTITMKFDYYADPKAVIRLFKLLQYPMTLQIIGGNEYYREIDCRIISNAENTSIVYHAWEELTIQLECSDPYFKNKKNNVKVVNSADQLPNVSENDNWYIQLPTVATIATNTVSILNDGDTKIYPVITVQNHSDVEGTDTGNVQISMGERVLSLLYHISKGEVITFDLVKRKITSSTLGDVTNLISDDTILSNMYLDVGETTVSIASTVVSDILEASAEYNIKYGMAVI